jgi:hypothetical protein
MKSPAFAAGLFHAIKSYRCQERTKNKVYFNCMNKYKIFGSVTVLGILCTLLGAWMRILHMAYSKNLLTIGMFAEAIGLSALAWFLFEWLEKKNK